MPDHTLSRLTPRPVFDAAAFVETAHTGPLPEETLQKLQAQWPGICDGLNAWRVEAGNDAWLMLWLDETTEQALERSWAESPARGFLEHALAVHSVMAAAAEIIPELRAEGCAPVSPQHPALTAAARDLGLDWPEDGTLCRRYALVTRIPFAGGCEACALHADCPRLKTC